MDSKPARVRPEGGAAGTERVRRGHILIGNHNHLLICQFVLFIVIY